MPNVLGRWRDPPPSTRSPGRTRRSNSHRSHFARGWLGTRPKRFALAGGPGATLGWCKERRPEPALAGGKTSTKNTSALFRDLSFQIRAIERNFNRSPEPLRKEHRVRRRPASSKIAHLLSTRFCHAHRGTAWRRRVVRIAVEFELRADVW